MHRSLALSFLILVLPVSEHLLAVRSAYADPTPAPSAKKTRSRSTPAPSNRARTPPRVTTLARLKARDLHIVISSTRSQRTVTVSAVVVNTSNSEARDVRVFAAAGSQLVMPLRGPSRLLPGARAAFFGTGRYLLRVNTPLSIRSFCRTCTA